MKTGSLLIITLIISSCIFAQKKKNPADNIIGKWLSQQKTGVIEIYKRGAKFYGKLVWMKDSIDSKTKKPLQDTKNPDPNLRNRPLRGLEILVSAQYVGNYNYKEGKIYDPEGGDFYSCKLKLSEDGNTLYLRGYLGISLIGRTETWSRIKELPK
ncbi:MAG: DUF2147 domain-containing protein [Bacteroidia bacterium]|nr:DUF2147 domain-containing protein [Bacteroidia bacterium]